MHIGEDVRNEQRIQGKIYEFTVEKTDPTASRCATLQKSSNSVTAVISADRLTDWDEYWTSVRDCQMITDFLFPF